MLNLFTSFLLLSFTLICFTQVDARLYNTTNPIEEPKRWFFKTVTDNCAKAVREDDLSCTAKYQALYNKEDEKSFCCYYYAMYECLDKAIKSKCDLSIYKNFRSDKIFSAVTEAITSYDCPNYPNYESCHFPLKKVLIISISVGVAILVIIALLLYKHYRTGSHSVVSNQEI